MHSGDGSGCSTLDSIGEAVARGIEAGRPPQTSSVKIREVVNRLGSKPSRGILRGPIGGELDVRHRAGESAGIDVLREMMQEPG